MHSVSLAIMVRDDAVRLKRCIESTRNAVDEVVVLDTGSKDDGVDVARNLGARVHQIEWPNNFAQALNVLLEQVKTDWTLRLDSDEWFDSDPKTEIQNCIAQEDAHSFRLVRRDIQPHGGYEEIALIRLWRTSSQLRYAGVVHENIPSSAFEKAWPGRMEKLAPLWFWHDGYGQGHIDKIRRNIPLMEQEIAKNPNQPYYEAMLAKGYKDVGDERWLPMMMRIAERSLAEAEPASPVVSVIFVDVLNSIAGNDLTSPKTDQILARALQWFPATPQILVAASNLELRRGRKDRALDLLLILEQMATTGQYDRSMPVNPALFGKQFWKHLDHIADQLGRWEICKRCDAHL